MTVGSLFAGIGGIDLGFRQAGFNVSWAIEKDDACCSTYSYNYPETYLIHDDIRNVRVSALNKVDVLAAGFPCQPFSVAGKQKGFNDKRGNLFFEVVRFTAALLPEYVFLENVPNLIEHDGGKTFLTIYNAFAELGYTIKYRVMRTSEYGNLPQIRDRIYIVAFKNQIDCDRFRFPDKIKLTVSSNMIIKRNKRKNDVYYCTDDIFGRKAAQVVKDKNSIYRVYHDSIKPIRNKMCPTLTASMGISDNQVPLIIDNYGVRKLTVRECLDFQGLPKTFGYPDGTSLKEAYKQIGNSVSVPVVKRIATKIKKQYLMGNN